MKSGEKGVITDFSAEPEVERRLEALGLRRNKEIKKVSEAGRSGPVVVEVDGGKIALGRGVADKILIEVKVIKILLMGNPNVGKSVVFSRLTGLDVISANYPGTTVGFTRAPSWIGRQRVEIIDAPGAYTLEPTSKAEEVAAELLKEANLAIVVIDATNLERNLFLTLQVLEKNIPTILVLNKWDIARSRGINIDLEALAKRVGPAVVPLVAVTGEGLKKLAEEIEELINRPPAHYSVPPTTDAKWQLIGEVSRQVQKIVHKHPTFLEKMADVSIQPVSGFLIAILVLFLSFYFIRSIGEFLINLVTTPLFEKIYSPWITSVVGKFLPWPIVQNLLLGSHLKAMESFGVLTTGIYIPFVLVLPYIFSFYLVMSFLEDLGYLPRLAVLADRWLHKIGLHGYAGIPVILGLGCKVPAVLATRVLESKKQKFIALALICLVAPCLPQSAMIFSVLGKYGLFYLAVIFGIIFMFGIASSFFLSKILKGETPELFLEIPSYQWPHWPLLLRKLWVRTKGFLVEAVPLIIAGIFLVNILDLLGVLNFFAQLLGPFFAKFLGLPADIVSVVMVGFLRKDISIGLLIPYNLTAKQLTVASAFLVLYLPCLATFFVVLKELGLKDTLKILGLTISVAFLTSFLLNIILF